MIHSRALFDEPPEDPNYSPLPEDQSGPSWNRQDVEREDAGQGQNEDDPQQDEN